MVRNIVGTLVDVGRGALSVEDFARILAARDRTRAVKGPNGKQVPAGSSNHASEAAR